MTFRNATLAAAFLATSALAVNAQSTTADSQKMKDECEARSSAQAQTPDPDARKAMKQNNEAKEANKKADREMTVAALPNSAGASKDAEQANRENVENTRPAPDGAKMAETGPAKPVENWFGCPPEKTGDAKGDVKKAQ